MRFLLFVSLLFLPAIAHAAPQDYIVELDRSQVHFIYTLEGSETAGMMPIKSAQINLDLRNPPNSHLQVTLDAAEAKAGFFIATDIMRGHEILDVANYPEIQFQSTSISGSIHAATLHGQLTIRGRTRPITLMGQVFNQQQTGDDLSKLTINLTGQLDRRDFNAGGYASMVGPILKLQIIARIRRAP